MKRFDKIIGDIKSVNIQGATNIAKAGINAFLLQPTKGSSRKILSARPTEPLLQNSIKILLNSKSPQKIAKKFLDYIKKSDKKISINGAKLIKDNMNIFTHCHSSTVVSILKRAKKQKKKFVVYNTETQPLLQGRKTALELAKAKIKVVHLPDLASEDALKKCDLFLFGSDAFLKNKVVNKTGTNMLAKIARIHNVPRYSCGISLKYAKKIKIELRTGKEVWDERNRNIEIFNPSFSFLNSKYLSGVVSEFGILPYKIFFKKAKENLKRFSYSCF